MIGFILKNIKNDVLINTVLVAGSSLISGVLGILRDRLLALKFGASPELDAYFAAFRIPDFIYGILVMGGISAVFLPLLTESFKKDKKEGWYFVNLVINSFLFFAFILSIVLYFIAPLIILIIVPGFSPEQRDLTISLTRIMLLSPLLLGLSSIFAGVSHYFNRFFAYSLAPILYNLGIIFGIFFFVPRFNVFGLSLGVIFGAFLHCCVQLFSALSCGFKYRLLSIKDKIILKIVNLVGWRLINIFIQNINIIFITAISSTISKGSISVLNFANNITNFVTGILGVSVSIVIFPLLSKAFFEKGEKYFWEKLNKILVKVLGFSFLFSLFLFLLRNKITFLIFNSQNMTQDHLKLVSACIGILSFGIPAFVSTPILFRGFFAAQAIKTLTKIGFIYIFITVFFVSILFWILSFDNIIKSMLIEFFKLDNLEDIKVIGLAGAISFSSVIYSLMLFFGLKKSLKIVNL
jgi:putative peptidoglycan lipid II flippase